jgi:phage FluMu gp28-like protein
MSTPNGVGNMFHSMHQACAANHYRLHTVSLSDAIADGLKVNEAECWSLAKGDPRLFDQLFNCKFLDGHAQYIPTEAVEACTVPFVGMGPGEFYAGLDIGRTVDLTVLVVVRCGPDRTRWVQEVLTCKRTSSDDLEAMVAAAFVKYNLRRVCVDATGMGAFPAERMQKIHGKQRVEPVNFTQGSKEDLATGMYSAFTESTVRLPRSDAKLRDDVCAIRRIVTSAGNIRYDAPRTDEGHADRAWALALALHSCRTPPNVKHIAPGR